jgi:hypothetical protein
VPSLRVLNRIVRIIIEAVAQKDKWSLTRCSGKHDECPHKVMQSVAYRRENGAVVPALFADLCRCDCHVRCPAGGVARVPDEEWLRSCTCPGSRQLRDLEVNQDTGQRMARVAEVFRDLEAGRRRPAEEMRQEVLDIAAARRAAYNAIPAPPPARYKREWGPALLRLVRSLALPAAAAVGAYFASGVLQVILIVLAALLFAWRVFLIAVANIALNKYMS